MIMITQYHINSPETLCMSKNVQDIYKTWTNEEIIADLDKKRSELVMVYMNVTHDFNKAVAIRSGNAFAIKESYIVGGGKRYDRRGCVGTHVYEHVFYADELEEVLDKLKRQDYSIYAVDCNLENTGKFTVHNLAEFGSSLPEKTCCIFGEECKGLDIDYTGDFANKYLSGIICVEQFGSVRSLNVSCSATCVMYEYSKWWNKRKESNKQ